MSIPQRRRAAVYMRLMLLLFEHQTRIERKAKEAMHIVRSSCISGTVFVLCFDCGRWDMKGSESRCAGCERSARPRYNTMITYCEGYSRDEPDVSQNLSLNEATLSYHAPNIASPTYYDSHDSLHPYSFEFPISALQLLATTQSPFATVISSHVCHSGM